MTNVIGFYFTSTTKHMLRQAAIGLV